MILDLTFEYTLSRIENPSKLKKIPKKPRSLIKKYFHLWWKMKTMKIKIKRASVKRWWWSYIPISGCIKIQPYYFILTIKWK